MSLKGWELGELSHYHELCRDDLFRVSARFQAHFLGLFLRDR
jgi:hypothetical protein